MKKQNKQLTKHCPTIIVITHDRPNSLKRLLNSLQKAHYTQATIPLIISIDQSDVNEEVISLAENFKWHHGEKQVIKQPKHLGLKKHVHACGNLLENCEAVIILEDDLLVAPYFYEYALQSLAFYEKEPKVAGISLYAYDIAESCFYPFTPIHDGFDNYFMQIASSWGQLWTKAHWNGFTDWIKESEEKKAAVIYPEYLKNWGKQSWKKEYIQYLVANDLYFVFPRISHTTNFEDRGTHASSQGLFQVPLQLLDKTYAFSNLEESKSTYDSWFELEANTLKAYLPSLKEYDFSVDLYGKKELQGSKEYRLTTRKGENAVFGFNALMTPLIQNVISEIQGDQIHLFQENKVSTKEADPSLFFPNSELLKNTLQKTINDQLVIEISIPIVAWNEEMILRTLQSIEKQSHSHWKCHLVCHDNKKEIIEQFLRKHQCSAKIQTLSFSEELTTIDLVEKGFQEVNGDIMCWVNPNAIVHQDWFKTVNKIFITYKSVRWLQCIDMEKSSLDFRWNKQIFLNQIKRNKKKHPTEGMCIAKHIWHDMGNQFGNKISTLKEEDWILNTLENYKKYVFIDTLHDIKFTEETKEIEKEAYKNLQDVHGAKKSSFSLFSTLFKKLYTEQVPYARAFYSLLHNLYDVIRYDEEKDSYYFDRY